MGPLYALESTRFYPQPESYITGLHAWGMWSCFYFLPVEGETIRGRVIVESWITASDSLPASPGT